MKDKFSLKEMLDYLKSKGIYRTRIVTDKEIEYIYAKVKRLERKKKLED